MVAAFSRFVIKMYSGWGCRGKTGLFFLFVSVSLAKNIAFSRCGSIVKRVGLCILSPHAWQLALKIHMFSALTKGVLFFKFVNWQSKGTFAGFCRGPFVYIHHPRLGWGKTGGIFLVPQRMESCVANLFNKKRFG